MINLPFYFDFDENRLKSAWQTIVTQPLESFTFLNPDTNICI